MLWPPGISSVYMFKKSLKMADLKAVDEFLLDGVLRRGVGSDTQALGRLTQTLLLVLVLRVCGGSLKHKTHSALNKTWTHPDQIASRLALIQPGRNGTKWFQLHRETVLITGKLNCDYIKSQFNLPHKFTQTGLFKKWTVSIEEMLLHHGLNGDTGFNTSYKV